MFTIRDKGLNDSKVIDRIPSVISSNEEKSKYIDIKFADDKRRKSALLQNGMPELESIKGMIKSMVTTTIWDQIDEISESSESSCDRESDYSDDFGKKF